MRACLDRLRKALLVHGRAAIRLQHRGGAADALDDLQEDGRPVAQRLREDLQQHSLRPAQATRQAALGLSGQAEVSTAVAGQALCCGRESGAAWSRAQDNDEVHAEAEASGL